MKNKIFPRFLGNRWPLFFSVVLSAAILTFFFSRINFGTFWKMIISASRWGILGYVFLAAVNVWLRAFRYQILIGRPRVKMADLILVTLVRNCTVDLFPHRLGELAYVFLLNQKFRLPLKSATASFILAVLFDYLAVAPIIFISLLFVKLENPAYFCGLLAGLIFVVILVFFLPAFLFRAKNYLAGFFKGPFKIKIAGFLEEIGQEIDRAKAQKIYLPVFFLSLAIRVVKYLSLFFLAAAFFRVFKIHWHDLSFSHVVLGTVGAELTSFLPVKGIAGLGTWEAAWAVVMKMLGYPVGWGIATGLGVHLTTQIFEYLPGALAFVYIYWRPIKNNEGKNNEKRD